MDRPAPTTAMGESAAEALITLLDQQAEFLLVVDRAGQLRGAVAPADFAVSTATAGVALRQQLARAGSVEDLVQLGRRAAGLLDDLLARGLAANKVIAVYSATIDAMVRRALVLTFARASRPRRRRLHLAVAGQQRPARGGAQLRRRLAPSPSPRASSPASRRATAPPSPRSTRSSPPAGVGVDEHGATAAAPAVRAHRRRVAGGGRGLAGRPGREQGRDHDVAARRRAPDPRRPRPAGREQGLQRSAPPPGHDAPAAARVAVAPGPAALAARRALPPRRHVRPQGPRPRARSSTSRAGRR